MKSKFDEMRDEVLYEFSIEPNKDSATLGIYLQKYPQYRDELIDLSVELFAAPREDFVPVNEGDSRGMNMAWEKLQSSLLPSDPVCELSVPENPLVTLDKKSFRALAKKLDINILFLAMLRDKTIEVSTIPLKFIGLLSEELSISIDSLRSSLAGSSIISTSVRFKADGKPTASEQISFEDALQSCKLSDSQKEKLMSMKD